MADYSSVIVDNLDVVRFVGNPAKTYTPLIVDSDAVLAETIALQPFQAIAWRRAQIGQGGSSVYHGQLSNCRAFERPETPNGYACE
jgi:hypothetical protein